MKLALFIGLALIIIPRWGFCMESNKTEVIGTPQKEILLNKVVTNLRSYFFGHNDESNTFVGRCIGLAKKIRQILPIAIFKMGVIMTLLVFLTLFSMKSLGLLGALLLINTSGAVAKIATAFAHKEKHSHPQTVHYHIHKDDDHHGYHIGHSGPGPDWDRSTNYSPDYDVSKIESYNLYNKLMNSLPVRKRNS